MSMRIPDKRNICCSSKDDPLPYYYVPLICILYRKRLEMASIAMGNQRFNKILEIGYGSGIFLPELSTRCNELYAIDIHTEFRQVKAMLKAEKTKFNLQVGSLLNLPFDNEIFDCIVCISVLEHIHTVSLAIKEILRVSTRECVFILGFPVTNKLTNYLFKSVGFNSKRYHPSTHTTILQELQSDLIIEKKWVYPPVPLDYALYTVCKCKHQWV